jgi:hypothetical protein
MAVCPEIHTKHLPCVGRKKKYLMVDQVVHKVNTLLGSKVGLCAVQTLDWRV